MITRRFGLFAPLAATIINLMMVYVTYFLARLIYLAVNYSYFSQGLTFDHLIEMFGGGLVFDTSAILVTNSLYIVLMLLPYRVRRQGDKETRSQESGDRRQESEVRSQETGVWSQ